MGKEYTVQEALKLAIKSEKDSMDFYRKAASATGNQRAKKVFLMLAGEEGEHLASFYCLYKGNEFGDMESFMATPPDRSSAAYSDLSRAIDRDTHEQQALEIALREEKALIDRYLRFAADMVDPQARAIFERVVRETRKHYELIESEYAHIMRMVHESDQDIFVRE
jgi:erythrin-vacuolar iron transport family protein